MLKNHRTLHFFIMFFFWNMGIAVYGNFIPLYLDSIGHGLSFIGLFQSVSPMFMAAGYLFWGNMTDRAKYKNHALIAAAIAYCSVILFQFSTAVPYILTFGILYAFTCMPANSMADSISLELTLTEKSMQHSLARIGGTVSFACIAVVAGYIIQRTSISSLFQIYTVIAVAGFIGILSLPKVAGHRRAGQSSLRAFRELLRDRHLVAFMLLMALANVGGSYKGAFGSLYVQNELGGSSLTVGVATFVAVIAEVPMLLIFQHVLRRFKIRSLVLFATGVLSLQPFLIALAPTPAFYIAIQFLQGSHMLGNISVSTYIARTASPENRASGVLLFSFMSAIVGIIVPSVSGRLTELVGYKPMLVLFGCIAAAVVLLWRFVVFKRLPVSVAERPDYMG